MRKVLVYFPVVLSLLVLGAHFLRDGNSGGVIGALALIVLLFIRSPWIARLVQFALVFGALEWALTTWELVQMRSALGQPFLRMVVILTVVATVTLCSALLFETPTMKRVYRRRDD